MKNMAMFSSRYDFPHCLGAVDGTHIEIKRPSHNATDFINRKAVLQLTCKFAVTVTAYLWMLS